MTTLSQLKRYFTDDELKNIKRLCKITDFYLAYTQEVIANSSASIDEKEDILDILSKNVYLCGGAFRTILHNNTFNDLDIAFTTQEAADKLQMFLLKHKINNFSVTKNNNFCVQGLASKELGIRVEDRLSFNFMFTGSPDEVLSSFDFTCNQNYYYPLNGEIMISKDIKAKLLISCLPLTFKGTAEGLNAIFRTLRFIQEENYKINNANFIQILKKCLSEDIVLQLDPILKVLKANKGSSSNTPYGNFTTLSHPAGSVSFNISTISDNNNDIIQEQASVRPVRTVSVQPPPLQPQRSIWYSVDEALDYSFDIDLVNHTIRTIPPRPRPDTAAPYELFATSFNRDDNRADNGF